MKDIDAKEGLIKRLTEAFGKSIRFEQPPNSPQDDTVFTLDPLALDRHVAAIKAAKKGKSTSAVSSKSTHLVSGPILAPSKSERLAADDYNTLMMTTFPEYENLKPGDWSAENKTFVAWDLAQRYPLDYIGKTNRPKAKPFFDAMTEEHTWDFFYVYHPKALDKPPIIYVPTEQFEHLLAVINASVQTALTVPPGKPGEKFYIVFGQSCTIRPKFIGRSSSQDEYDALKDTIPDPEHEDACEDATFNGMDMLLFNLKAHKAHDANMAKAKAKAKKRKEKTRNRDESIYDTQLYLGLRPLASAVGEKNKEVAIDRPVPHALNKNVTFISIDIEVAEEHHGTILEVGITTLDTNDIADFAPGEVGRNWFPYIKSRHLVSHEHKHMRNHKYIQGCPELFNFGESEYPKVKDIPEMILAAFDELSTLGVLKEEDNYRNIVLVGHDINADLDYMASMGVHPWGMKGMFRCIDTKDMHQAWRKIDQGRKLGFVLQDLDIPCENLHNAGNDAAYTLRAMIGLAVQARLDEQ